MTRYASHAERHEADVVSRFVARLIGLAAVLAVLALLVGPRPAAGADATPDATRIDFGTLVSAGGPSAIQALRIANSGGPAEPLEFGSASLVGPDAEQFSIWSNGCSGQELEEGESCVIELRLAPLAAKGAMAATLELPFNDPEPLRIALSGSVTDAPHLFWSGVPGGVGRTGLDGSGSEVISPDSFPLGVAVDPARGHVYWAASGSVHRADRDGDDRTTVVEGFAPHGLAVDAAAEVLYWTDAAGVYRANLDGSQIEPVLVGGVFPWAIALDEVADTIYWSDLGTGAIHRVNTDGTDANELLSVQEPNGLDVDPIGGTLVWTERGNDRIRRANLDGGNVVELAGPDDGVGQPAGVVIDRVGRYAYWAEEESTGIRRVALDGSVTGELAGAAPYARYLAVERRLYAPVATPDVHDVDFGARPLADGPSPTRELTITNTSNAASPLELKPGEAVLVGADADQFQIVSDGCDSQELPQDTSCVVELTFAPTTNGAKQATLQIPSNDPGGPVGIALTGTGVSGEIEAQPSPESVAFTPLDIGHGPGLPVQVRIESSGDLDLEPGAARIVGPDSPDFSVETDGCEGRRLAPSEDCIIEVVVDPSVAREITATLEVPSNAPNSPTRVPLTGVGLAGRVALDTSRLELPATRVGDPFSTETTRITNSGDAPLTIGSDSQILGPDADDFSVQSGCAEVTLPEASTAACSITVAFDPGSAGQKSATLEIPSNDPDSPATIALSGLATANPGLQPDDLQIIFTETVDEPDSTGTVVPNTDVYARDPAQTRRVRLTRNDGVDSMAQVSPDGTRFAYVRHTANGNRWHLRVRSVGINDDERLLSERDPFGRPTFSADGTAVIAPSAEGLLEVPIADPAQRRVIDSPSDDSTDPAVAASGEIIVSRPRDVGRALAVIDDQGAVVRWLTDGTSVDTLPAISPDGTTVYFARRDVGLPETKNQVFAVAMDGSQAMPDAITSAQVFNYATSPGVSPDGSRLVVEAGVGGVDPDTGEIRFPDRLYLMDADGTDISFLSLGTEPAWRGMSDMCGTQGDIPATECDALVALFDATNGSAWTRKARWIDVPAPCRWQGVSCVDGHVAELTLADRNLVGQLPEEIGALTELDRLVLRDNSLTGPIPSSIGRLTKLTEIRAQRNQLTGPIPAGIENLTQLSRLTLQQNALSGAVRSGLPSLPNIDRLRLRDQGGCLTAIDQATADAIADRDPQWDNGCAAYFAGKPDAVADWIRERVITSGPGAGALTIHQDPGFYGADDTAWRRVVPYRASLAVYGLLRAPETAGPGELTRLEIAEGWIDWYLDQNRLRPAGADPALVYDHWYTPGGDQSLDPDGAGEATKTTLDAADSYAATLLMVAGAYLEAGGDPAFLAERIEGLRAVAEVIYDLRDDDGLVFALPQDRLRKYTMDNSEVAAGLTAMDAIEDALDTPTESTRDYGATADEVEAAIQAVLREPEGTDDEALYRIGIVSGQPSPVVKGNWFDIRGGTAHVVWPHLLDAAPATGTVVDTQMAAVNDFPWTSEVVDEQGMLWPSVGHAALLAGDTFRARQHAEFVLSQTFPADNTEEAAPPYPFLVDDAGWLLQTLDALGEG